MEAQARRLQPKVDPYASRTDRLHLLEMLFFASKRIVVGSGVTDCRDPNDNAFLALAVDGAADAISGRSTPMPLLQSSPPEIF